MPVSTFTKPTIIDGSLPENTAFREKRNVAAQVPAWDAAKCIECGKCGFACPHATIRSFLLTEEEVAQANQLAMANGIAFDVKDASPMYKGAKEAGLKFRIQVSPQNCVGCLVCVEVCPTKALSAADVNTQQKEEPLADYLYKHTSDKAKYGNLATEAGVSLLRPYFEVSGACAGCGEAPYYRLASQLFGKVPGRTRLPWLRAMPASHLRHLANAGAPVLVRQPFVQQRCPTQDRPNPPRPCHCA